MNPRHTAGLVSLLAGAVGLAGCSQSAGLDGRMFERWADSVAAIPIDDGSSHAAAPSESSAPSTSSTPSRQARSPLKIDLTDAAAPQSAKALGLRAAEGLVDSELAGLRSKISFKEAAAPAASAAPVSGPAEAGAFLAQLGAFPTRKAAESGWARLKASHPDVLGKLSARFEAVDLGDRGVWTRLQAGPFPARDQAAAVCSGIGAPERWCVVARQG
jgi:cell division protein FtsN